MIVKLYTLKFCGLFEFSDKQKHQLLQSNNFKKEEINPTIDAGTWENIKDQYYPSFRRFITNESSFNDDFTILSNTDHLDCGSFEKVLMGDSGNTSRIKFSLKNVEIFFFRNNPGIISMELALELPVITVNEITLFVNHTRSYNSMVIHTDSGAEIDMRTLIQDKILNDSIDERSFVLSEKSKVDDYRGSKLKVFQCIELESAPQGEVGCLLFELATMSPIGSMSGNEVYNSHSEAYYQDIMKKSISVYKNWQALCLFDTFTMVGFRNLTNTMTYNTWTKNYFRIYVYDLYYKYSLFSINAEGIHTTSRLKKQRHNLNEFIKMYDIHYISYNFLPNLLHQRIRQGLDADNETDKIRNKIDRMTHLINEQSSSLTNIILFVLALIALLPSNINDLYDSKNNELNIVNLTSLLIKIVIIILVWAYKGKFIRRSFDRIKNYRKS